MSFFSSLFRLRETSKPTFAPLIGIDRHRIITDGDGITTLVAFHGCKLKCAYCLNPQSITPKGIWKRYSPKQLLKEVYIDRLYFSETEGGICFGGGEPLLYSDFLTDFKYLSPSSWKIIVETSLNIPQNNLIFVSKIVDRFIVDIKDMNPQIYRKYTGHDNMLVKDNLRWLFSQGLSSKMVIRIPLIPGFNNMEDVNRSISELKEMGFKRFDRFTYKTSDYLNKRKPFDDTDVGKNICKYLKLIRIDAAIKYGIKYTPMECHYAGPCAGTCPVCDKELKELSQQIVY